MTVSEQFTFFITTALCLLISTLIVIHSYDYILNYFSAPVALAFASVIEISFVSVSIIGALTGRWNYWDRVLKAILFFLSVVPATMQSSQEIRQIVFENITAVPPAEPLKLNFQGENLTHDLQIFEEEIYSLRKSKNSYAPDAEARAWYVFQDQKRIDTLLKKREKISGELNQLDADYEEQLRVYQVKKQEFQKQSSVNSYESWFDFAFLLWSVLLIWVFQLLNARLSSNAALLLIKNNARPFRNFEESSYDDPVTFADFELIRTLPELIQEYSYLIKKEEAETFLKRLDILNLEDLEQFFEKENWVNGLAEKLPAGEPEKYIFYLENLRSRIRQ